ncbi:flagellar basal-body MS-ring/collar protein FliF [Vogesella sp. GCM10023246]|uniref:Flagellar M-ring protein n=1 Tax=Vogesella oryzagri TaxID=3160864 RepID=A0ABV1M771_9NEIS
MINSLKSRVGRIASARSLWSPSALRMLLPMLLLAAGITALAMMYLWHDDARYKPVFGAQERVPAADMMAVLDAEQIHYRIHPASGQVLVPEDELGRVRMLLAGKGVVAKLPDGLELVDKNDPLGVSQFVQDVRFRRGLEGELAQSIMALGPVANARVHLSLARSSSFVSSDGEKSSASVMLNLKPGQQLNAEQTLAVINLVSGSVASLEPARVTVVDQDGNFLSAHVDTSEGVAGLAGGSDAASRFRNDTLRNVRELLAPTLGDNNFKVSVTADVDNDRVEETREQYGEAPKVTNEAVRDEQDQEPLALGVPGSLSNRPVTIEASAPAGAAPNVSRKNAATRQYAYDRTITQVKRSRGSLKRLSVAVVLNNSASPTPANGWSPAQLANIDRILRNGLGLDAARGDKLVVSSLSFPAREAPLPWWQERSTVESAVGYGLYALMLLLGWLLLVRPLFKLLREWLATRQQEVELNEIAMAPQAALAAPQEGAEEALAANPVAALAAPAAAALPMVPLLENYDLPPAGSSVDVLVDHLKTLAGKEPERVAEVVKQWVQKRG